MKLRQARIPFFIISSSFVLTACMHAPIKDTASPYYNPPVGSHFVLNQAITLPLGDSRVFFQQGQTSTRGFNRFEPHCQLDVKGFSDGNLTLEPKTYEITKVTYKTPFIVLTEPVRLASVTQNIKLAMRDSDGPSEVIEVVEMIFKPSKENQALKLVCGGVQDTPSRTEPPSIDEIRFALGEKASLKLSESN